MNVGDNVVVRGVGAGTVTRVDVDRVHVATKDGEVGVALGDAAELISPVMDRRAAEDVLARLCERVREERTLPALQSIRAFERAPLGDRVQYARLHFRKRAALSGKERDTLGAAVEGLLDEVALAL